MKNIFTLTWIGFIGGLFSVFIVLNTPEPLALEGDGVFYYSWFHSVFFDGDIDFANQLNHFATYDHYSAQYVRDSVETHTGFTPNPYGFGSALYWSFFLLPMHYLFKFIGLLGITTGVNGLGMWYVFTVNFASWVAGIGAFFFCYKIARFFVPRLAAGVATFLLWVGTPWFYYHLFEPSMSHSVSLFFVSIFWYYALCLYKGREIPLRFFAFIVFFVAAIRWQDVLFVLPVFILLYRTVSHGAFRRFGYFILIGVGIFALIQASIWKVLYGAWVLIPQGASFVWGNFHGLYVIFSSDRGILLWAPIIVIACASTYFLRGKNSLLACVIIVTLFLQWGVNAILSDPGGGDAYGPRRFVSLIPFLVVPLAFLVTRVKNNILLAALVCGIAGWSLLLYYFFRIGIIPRSGAFDMLEIFYTVI